MRVNIMPSQPRQLSGWPSDLKDGLEKHGDSAVFTQHPDESDVHAFWGMKQRRNLSALAKGGRCIVVERAYLGNRHHWRAMGFNGLNGFADFCNSDVPDDRWKRYWKGEVKPWKKHKGYALVIGQIPGDASLRGRNPYDWANEVATKAWKHYGDVRFRPHPDCHKKHAIQDADTIGGSLDDALDGAEVVITFNSNTAVDAVMRGIPAITMDRGSMAWAVSSHELGKPLYRGDREDWGRKIAYSQWLPDEIRSGEAWAHLRPHV